MIYTTLYTSPMGDILLAEREGALRGLWMDGQKYFLGSIREEIDEKKTAVLKKTMRWLDDYFAGKQPAIGDIPLAPEGSDFRRRVWELLCEIPYGETVTYGDLAKKLAASTGARVSAQAVGGAVGHNPVSIIIPCHRVVGAGGNLTGYAGGIEKKIRLLTHEGVDMTRFFVPKKGTAL